MFEMKDRVWQKLKGLVLYPCRQLACGVADLHASSKWIVDGGYGSPLTFRVSATK